MCRSASLPNLVLATIFVHLAMTILMFPLGASGAAECLPGTITTVAGSGEKGDSGDGGDATKARLDLPCAVAVGADGSVYVAQMWSHRIRKVDAAGLIRTVVGDGECEHSGDGGPATKARFCTANGLAVGPDGSLYIAATVTQRIRKVDPAGIITTVAGNGAAGFAGDGGPATEARLDQPTDVAVGPDGSLYIADSENNRIRKVDPAGVITTVAGDGWTDPETGWGRCAGDGGPATQGSLFTPNGVAVSADGIIYIADTNNNRIRKVDAAGIITTLAGNGRGGSAGDAATKAGLCRPHGVAVGPDGSVYMADVVSDRIRKIDAAGIITTVAGNGRAAYSGDGGLATKASISVPHDVAVGADGAIYIADTFNYRIRKVCTGRSD